MTRVPLLCRFDQSAEQVHEACSILESCLARLGSEGKGDPQRRRNYGSVETALDRVKQQAKLRSGLIKASHATHMQTQQQKLSQMDTSRTSQLSTRREDAGEASSDEGSSSSTPAASPRENDPLSSRDWKMSCSSCCKVTLAVLCSGTVPLHASRCATKCSIPLCCHYRWFSAITFISNTDTRENE